MPITHETKLYAVSDAKIAKLLTDPTGGAATYGSLIDLPGIKEVGLGFVLNAKELRGDNKQLDADTTLVGVTLTFSNAKISLDALAVMLGGTVTDSGVTPNQKAQLRRLGSDVLSYFKFEAKTPTGGIDVATGDAHLVVYKAKVQSGFDLGFAEEDYRIFSGEARGVVRLADDFLYDLVENETAAAIT